MSNNEIIELLKLIGVPALILIVYQGIGAVISRKWGTHKSTEAGLRSLLRDRLIQSYNHNVYERKYCPIYEKENVTDMYNQYHNLGGNGTVTKLYHELMELPTEPKEEIK